MTATAAACTASGVWHSSRCRGSVPREPTVPGARGERPQPNQVASHFASTSASGRLERAAQGLGDHGLGLLLPLGAGVPAQRDVGELADETDLAVGDEARLLFYVVV